MHFTYKREEKERYLVCNELFVKTRETFFGYSLEGNPKPFRDKYFMFAELLICTAYIPLQWTSSLDSVSCIRIVRLHHRYSPMNSCVEIGWLELWSSVTNKTARPVTERRAVLLTTPLQVMRIYLYFHYYISSKQCKYLVVDNSTTQNETRKYSVCRSLKRLNRFLLLRELFCFRSALHTAIWGCLLGHALHTE